MILKNFCDQAGMLHFHRIDFSVGEVRATSIDNLFVKKHLYSTIEEDGLRDDRAERFFSRMESFGEMFLSQLLPSVRSGTRFSMDENAWNFWRHFFYYHMKRTPHTVKSLQSDLDYQGSIESTLRSIEEEFGPISDQEKAALMDPETQERLFKNAVIDAQIALPHQFVVQAMNSLGLGVFRITRPRKNFIIGDPILIACKASHLSELGLRGSGFVTLFPVAHDVALAPFGEPPKIYVFDLKDSIIRLINEQMFLQSEIVASRSAQLLISLSEKFRR
jgi:hypothetical protein